VASQPLPPNSGAAPPPPTLAALSVYSTPAEATKAIQERYNYWTGKLNDVSLQLSFAVIAANWAVFKTSDGVIRNCWSKTSIGIAIVGIAANLLATWWMGEALGDRVADAESDLPRWQLEYQANTGKRTVWPFTKQIIVSAKLARHIRIWIPIAAGFALLIGLFRV
jgi:hypothetical protein